MHRKDLAFVFPGQGSQTVGMMNDWKGTPAIAALYEEASSVLGFDLWKMTEEGPADTLNQSQNTQPALLVASIAVWHQCLDAGLNPSVVAGHSLGEYSALVATGSIAFADAVRLVAARGAYMQEAVPAGVGAMAAILGSDRETIEGVCRDVSTATSMVQAANLNAAQQTVIAGHREAVEKACEVLKNLGAKRALILPVSVPSHCELMRPAAVKLSTLIDTITIQAPDRTLIHNVDIQSHMTPESIREALVSQLFMPVQWIGTVEWFTAHGIKHVVECGPGKVLTGLIKRIEPSLGAYSIATPAELETTRGAL